MKTREYKVHFNTPAFLGNAEQQGQWRTPPFKALIRQWWRVAYAEAHRYPQSTVAMRREEGLLFGHAWLDDDQDERGQQVAARKSKVRIRLDRWEIGKQKNWDGPDQPVRHPEVKNRQGQMVPVGSNLYLGYGPLMFRNGTALKANAAIQAGETAIFAIACPDEHAPRIERALWLMDRYATAGGRSRNGWGSFALLPLPLGEGRGEGMPFADATPLRPWRDCLSLDWPHAIGQDEHGALIWQTRPCDDWKALMQELAVVKIGLRTQFIFKTGKFALQTEARHWLSYPITNHSVQAWGNNARLPNSLRFKARQTPAGKLVGVIFHVPCLPPPDFNPDRNAIQTVWQNVHLLLDELARPTTERAYRSVADAARRTQLKAQLDTLTLQRISE
jgi:CRISPR-associated protein Cmr1